MKRETLVLIPGTLCDATLFAHQVAGLADLADCRVVDSSGADDLGAAAEAVLEGVAGRFSLLGLSYGGIIAFEIMRRARDRVSKLVLLHTNYQLPSETTRTNQERWVGMTGLGRFEEVPNLLADVMLHPDHARDPAMRAVVLHMSRAVGPVGFVRQVKAQLGRPDSRADLPKIACPTLLITGAEDRICPVALHEEMAALIPRSKLEIIEQCGHLSTLEQPERVTRCIRSWWLDQTTP